MAVRLVTPAEVEAWQAAVLDALAAAKDRQKAALTPLLRANGLGWSSPAGQTALVVWDQDAWAAAVARDLEPAVRRAARHLLRTVKGRVAAGSHWGMADPTDRLVAMVVDKALAAGPRVARRLSLRAAAVDERYGGVTHPEASPTILDEYQVRFVELDRLTERVTAHMSDAAQQVLAETAGEQGPGIEYVWNAVGDEVTRPDHDDADGQSVRAGDTFDVGGEALLYPGDPAGSDENVDNCRCWLEVEGMDLDRDFEASLAMDAEG